MNRNQLGRFKLPLNLISGEPEMARDILQEIGFLPIRVEISDTEGVVNYEGLSELFDKVDGLSKYYKINYKRVNGNVVVGVTPIPWGKES